MQKKIIISLIILILLIVGTVVLILLNNDGSNNTVASYKNYNELVIAVSEEDLNSYLYNSNLTMKEFLESTFSDVLLTPQKENLYNVKFEVVNNISNFEKIKGSKNLIIFSLDDPIDSTLDIIYKEFKGLYKLNNVDAFKNIYTENQLVFFINATTGDSMQSIFLSNYSDWVKSLLDSTIQSALISNLDGQMDIEKQIFDNFNFNIELKSDYQIIEFDQENNFLWIGRGYPDHLVQWITIHSLDEHIDLKNGFNHISMMKNINNSFMSESILDSSSNLKEEISLNISYIDNFKEIDDNVYAFNGLYDYNFTQKALYTEEYIDINNNGVKDINETFFDLNKNNKYDIEDEVVTTNMTGGPFYCRIFKNKEDEYIYVTGFVNYPNGNKLKYVREFQAQFNNINKGK